MTDPVDALALDALPPFDVVERSSRYVHVRGVVPASAACFQGHFPERAVVPGVVQLGWVLELVRLHTPLEPVPTRIDVLKFRNVIAPETLLDITLEIEPEADKASFQIRSGTDTVHSSGRIRFGAFDA